jgi:hypothetical protein
MLWGKTDHTLEQLLEETAARADEVLRLNIEDLDVAGKPRPHAIEGRRHAGFRGEWALPRALATLQRWATGGPLALGRRVFSSRAAAARSR